MKKAQAITDLLDNMGYEHGMYIRGLYPTSLDVEKGRFRDGKYDERKKKRIFTSDRYNYFWGHG